MSNRRVTRLLLVILSLLLFIKLSISLSYLTAGIDIGDEGQITMGARYPFLYKTFPYYQFTHAFFGTALGDTVCSRVLRIVFELMSVLFVSTGLYWWLCSVQPERKNPQNLLLIFLAAALSTNSYVFGRIIMYDDFTLFIPAVIFLMLSWIWFVAPGNKMYTSIVYLIVGVLCGFIGFIKPSALPLMLGVVSFLTLFQFKNQKQKTILAFTFLLTGIVTGIVGGVELIGGWKILQQDISEVQQLAPLWQYNLKSILLNYMSRDLRYLSLLAIVGLVSFAVANKSNPNLFGVILGGIVVLATVLFSFNTNSTAVKWLHVFLWILTASTLSASLFLLAKIETDRFNFWFILLLILFPYASAFGTANSIFENSSFFYSINYALAFIALFYFLPPSFMKYMVFFMLVSAGMFVVTQIVFPFGIPTGLFKQKQVALTADSRLTADSTSALFLNSVYETLLQNRFQNEDELIVTDGFTGIATLAGGTMNGMPFLMKRFPLFNRHVINQSGASNKKPMLISFSKSKDNSTGFFENTKLEFEENYQSPIVLHNAYQEAIKAYYGLETSDSIFIYVPQ